MTTFATDHKFTIVKLKKKEKNDQLQFEEN